MENIKEVIQIDDLAKLDSRVITILSVEELDKIVKLVVDFGAFKRTILVGMKSERKDPTEIVGEQTLFVVHLAPRKVN